MNFALLFNVVLLIPFILWANKIQKTKRYHKTALLRHQFLLRRVPTQIFGTSQPQSNILRQLPPPQCELRRPLAEHGRPRHPFIIHQIRVIAQEVALAMEIAMETQVLEDSIVQPRDTPRDVLHLQEVQALSMDSFLVSQTFFRGMLASLLARL
jgi:hypothetical protein